MRCSLLVLLLMCSLLTAVEQELQVSTEEIQCLLHINALRADPHWEAEKIVFGAHAGMSSMPPYLDIDKCRQEIQSLPTVPPLVFNVELMQSARAHAQYMITNDVQSHQEDPQLKDFIAVEPNQRILEAQYAGVPLGENIFLRSVSPWNSHRGFIIDWGPDVDGMQTPRGHRLACLSPRMREIGIACLRYENDFFMSCCHNFGNPIQTPRLIGGLIYKDTNNNAGYDAGEGVAEVNISYEYKGKSYSVSSDNSGLFRMAVVHREAIRLKLGSSVWHYPAGEENIWIQTCVPNEKQEQHISELIKQAGAEEIKQLDVMWQMQRSYYSQEQINYVHQHYAQALANVRADQIQIMRIFSQADKKAFTSRFKSMRAKYKSSLYWQWFNELDMCVEHYQKCKAIVEAIRASRALRPSVISKQIKAHARLVKKLRVSVFKNVMQSQELMLRRVLLRK